MIYFIQLFAVALLGKIINPKYSLSSRRLYTIITFGIIIAIAGLRSPEVGRDVAGHYAENYEIISNMRWNELFQFSTIGGGYELGYCYFNKLIGSLTDGNINWFLFITSLFIYGILGLFIYFKSPDPAMSSLLLIYSCQFYMYMTMLRQAMALCIVLLAWIISEKVESKKSSYLILLIGIILASYFHTSAILCIVIIFFKAIEFRRTTILISIFIILLFFLSYSSFYQITLDLLGSGNKYEMYEGNHADAKGYFNIQTFVNIILSLGAFILLVYSKFYDKRDIKNKQQITSFLLFMTLLAGTFRLMTIQMNILSRFSYYFIPFILIGYPIAYSSLGKKTYIIKQIMYFMYFLYFSFITIKYAETQYGVVPYKFGI